MINSVMIFFIYVFMHLMWSGSIILQRALDMFPIPTQSLFLNNTESIRGSRRHR